MKKSIKYSKIDALLKLVTAWLIKNEIGKTMEKKTDIAWSIFRYLYENKITESELELLINFINDNEFILEEGKLWDNLNCYFKNNKYVNLFKNIFNLTPPGLFTSPNAACGKGELFYRLLRPKSRQPNKGDIIDNSIKKELKGCEARISSLTITGKEYKKITDNLFGGIITGNLPKTGGLKGKECYEIEKLQYKSHYENEFKKIDLPTRITKFKKLLENLNIEGDILSKVNRITHSECAFNQYNYQRVLLEDWFSKYKKSNDFQELIFLGKGNNVKIIKEISDLDKMEIYDDYFRINQNGLIGWYIK
jgi:hypothetical protein